MKMNFILLSIYNLFRIQILKFLCGKNLKCYYIQYIHATTKIIIEDKNSKISIGRKAYFRENSRLSVNNGGILIIGDRVFINRNCMITSKDMVLIGDNTTIGPNVVIVDHDHVIRKYTQIEGFTKSKIIIGRNVWIGANVIILKGTIIGDNCVIAAGTILSGVIPDNKVVYQERNLKFKDNI